MQAKYFEITANGHSYGLYPGVDKMDAIENQTQDAGYKSVAEMLEMLDQTDGEFFSEVKAVEIELNDIRVDIWEDQNVAVFFTLCLDGEKVQSLEWIDSDGNLEVVDSHVESAHDFSGYLKDFIRDALLKHLDAHREEIDELAKAVAAYLHSKTTTTKGPEVKAPVP